MYKTRNFSPETDKMLTCSCCGKGGATLTLLLVLEDVKRHFSGAAVTINSCARCESHNKAVGGKPNSTHLITPLSPLACAADIVVRGHSPLAVYHYLDSTPYATLLGLGSYDTFTHVDTRGQHARW